MSKKLYVGNLAYSVRDEDLTRQFSEFGEVRSAKVMTERETGRSKGFGFVEMSSEKEAKAAILGLHDKSVDGRNLVVNEARPMEQRSRSSSPSGRSGGGRRDGGGGYGGGGYGGGGYGGGNQR